MAKNEENPLWSFPDLLEILYTDDGGLFTYENVAVFICLWMMFVSGGYYLSVMGNPEPAYNFEKILIYTVVGFVAMGMLTIILSSVVWWVLGGKAESGW